jgi:hypothetical protein
MDLVQIDWEPAEACQPLIYGTAEGAGPAEQRGLLRCDHHAAGRNAQGLQRCGEGLLRPSAAVGFRSIEPAYPPIQGRLDI